MKTRVDPYLRVRVMRELRAAGVSRYAMLRAEAQYLPEIIHPNEHIAGVVCGYSNGSYAMLVATDRRVIFLDRKPLFTIEDEVTYNVVAGIEQDVRGFFGGMTLHTRVKDYTIHYASIPSVKKFVEYIEQKCIELPLARVQ